MLKLGGVVVATSSVMLPTMPMIRYTEPIAVHGAVHPGAIDASLVLRKTVQSQWSTKPVNSVSATWVRPAVRSGAGVGEVSLLTKVATLHGLSDGYLGPGSLAPTTVALQNLALLGSLEPGVNVAPTAAGGVALEWRDKDVEYTAEIEADGSLFMCIDDPDEDVVESEVAYAVETLREFIRLGSLPANV
ncbi:hypothetical protein ACFVTX_04730 [Agromyces sp. NPDC058136]|uniref:hypothetical protein n=1 Tax=Agromyces sp. NPDC058136 TaxID=3346354 RepID=UPI0036DB74C9